MFQIILTCLGLAIILSVCIWAINQLAPDPIKKWATVVVVVLVACYIGAMLMGAAPYPQYGLHR